MKLLVLQPSSGTTIPVFIQNLATIWTDVLVPDYFSVPVRNRASATIDPDNSNRELLPGEIFVRSHFTACNKTANTESISVRVVNPDGSETMLVDELKVPLNETAIVPIQGRYLVQHVSRDRGVWGGTKYYRQGDLVTEGGTSYASLINHTSDVASQPGAGVSWQTYWEAVTTPYSPDPHRLQFKASTANAIDVSGAGLLTVNATDTPDPNA